MTTLSIGVFGKDTGIDFRRESKVAITRRVTDTWGKLSDLYYAEKRYAMLPIWIWEALALKDDRVLLCSQSLEWDYLEKLISFLISQYPNKFQRKEIIQEPKETLVPVDVERTLEAITTLGGRVDSSGNYTFKSCSFSIYLYEDSIQFSGWTLLGDYVLSCKGLEIKGSLSTFAHMTPNDVEEARWGFNDELEELKDVLLELAYVNNFPTKEIEGLCPKEAETEE